MSLAWPRNPQIGGLEIQISDSRQIFLFSGVSQLKNSLKHVKTSQEVAKTGLKPSEMTCCLEYKTGGLETQMFIFERFFTFSKSKIFANPPTNTIRDFKRFLVVLSNFAKIFDSENVKNRSKLEIWVSRSPVWYSRPHVLFLRV